MNIIRTKAVELSCIPAIAYKQKLQAGGAGIKIMRLDSDASAVGTLDRRTGEIVPYGKIDDVLFPIEAFDEALELVKGIPYLSRGNIVLNTFEQKEEEDVLVEETPKIDMVGSDEYKAIIERYSDEKGKLNYALMNKNFIQFTAKSKTVSEMVSDKAEADEILVFVIKNRAAFIANKKESLDDASVSALIETLDEIDPRSAFKELKAHINKLIARRK